MRTWLSSNMGVVVVGVGLTLIVLLESIFPPWAPYFIVYALLAILIPLALKSYEFGAFRAILKSNWQIIIGVFVVAVILDQGVFTWLYERFLAGLGLGGDPFYSLSAALELLANVAADKFGVSFDTALALYALFVVIWAPVGEELFYRGYMQGMLRQSRSFRTSALVSADFFGIRHATHLFFLWPAVPWVAMGAWVVSTFVFGLLMSYLYEKTHSLYPPILIHAVVNIIGVVLSL